MDNAKKNALTVQSQGVISTKKGVHNGVIYELHPETRNEWKQQRSKYIGGSDASAILGLSPYVTPVDVYYEKINGADEYDNDFMAFGRYVEDAIAQWFSDREGLTVRKDNKTRYHRQYSFLGANVDRIIQSVDDRGSGILEIKSTSQMYVRTWDTDDNGIPIPPKTWLAQIFHYLNVTGYQWGAICYIADRQYNVHWVNRTEKIDSDIKKMEGMLVDFWLNHIEKQVPPAPGSKYDVERLFPQEVEGKAVEATEPVLQELKRYAELKEQEKQIKEEIKAQQDYLATFMEDAEVLKGFSTDAPLLTYKARSSKRIDSKTLRKEEPEIAERYTTESTSRAMLLKPNAIEEEFGVLSA